MTLILCGRIPLNWTVAVWGVHLKEKVLTLFENLFFSILVKFITNVLREQEYGFQWRRGSDTSFFHNDLQESRKRGLNLFFLILSTAFLVTNEQLCATRIKARTTSQASNCKNDRQKRKTFPPIPGENTKYATCMLLQKHKPPPKPWIKCVPRVALSRLLLKQEPTKPFQSNPEVLQSSENISWEIPDKKAVQRLCWTFSQNMKQQNPDAIGIKLKVSPQLFWFCLPDTRKTAFEIS